jgi:Tol biopolymer transport system component
VSADGRWIVFASSRQGRSGIFIYNRDTRQVQNLVSNVVGEVRNPTISSDGQTIAFEVAINGQWDIQVYSRSGQPLNIP